jgi:hypothetical protein
MTEIISERQEKVLRYMEEPRRATARLFCVLRGKNEDFLHFFKASDV